MRFSLKNLLLAIIPFALSAVAWADELRIEAAIRELATQGVISCRFGDRHLQSITLLFATGLAILFGRYRVACLCGALPVLWLAATHS